MTSTDLPAGATAVVDHLRETRPGDLVGVWLHGSATEGGLRPDSDVDLLVVTDRSLSPEERSTLVEELHRWSGRRATRAPGRPLELVSVVRRDVVPWRYPPTLDLQYGEWLRDAGPEGPGPSPDLAVILTSARVTARTLVGPPLAEVVAPVPAGDLRRAVLDSLPSLVEDLEGDERNVLLTLARMVVTIRTGAVVPKDVAAEQVAREVPEAAQPLVLAARAYRGEVEDRWDDARPVAEVLARLVRG